MFGDGMFVFLVLVDTEDSVPSFLAQNKEHPAHAG
jgi:hypothetical protein